MSTYADVYSTSAKPWEWAWRATARLQDRREREREWRWANLNVLAARMKTYFLIKLWIIVWQGRLSGREQHVRWWGLLQVSAARTYPLLAHDLTVKLSPCPCSSAEWIATCQHVWSTTGGYPKRNLLLAQAHPMMMQHLSSKITHWIPEVAHKLLNT